MFAAAACSGSSSSERNLASMLVDRIWLTDNDTQYYFSSTDGRTYLWMASDLTETGEAGPSIFTIAKGTPQSHPLSRTSRSGEGWYASSFFKVENGQLIEQDEQDINGEDLTVFDLAIALDTSIGIIDYQTLFVTNQFGERKWRSKKR